MRKRDEEGDVCYFYQKCIKPVNQPFPSEDQIQEHEGGICFELCNVVLKKKKKEFQWHYKITVLNTSIYM